MWNLKRFEILAYSMILRMASFFLVRIVSYFFFPLIAPCSVFPFSGFFSN